MFLDFEIVCKIRIQQVWSFRLKHRRWKFTSDMYIIIYNMIIVEELSQCSLNWLTSFQKTKILSRPRGIFLQFHAFWAFGSLLWTVFDVGTFIRNTHNAKWSGNMKEDSVVFDEWNEFGEPWAELRRWFSKWNILFVFLLL